MCDHTLCFRQLKIKFGIENALLIISALIIIFYKNNMLSMDQKIRTKRKFDKITKELDDYNPDRTHIYLDLFEQHLYNECAPGIDTGLFKRLIDNMKYYYAPKTYSMDLPPSVHIMEMTKTLDEILNLNLSNDTLLVFVRKIESWLAMG
jgi:hypothetical protein